MMGLQSITELSSYSSFSDILVFVCFVSVFVLPLVFVIVFVFSIYTMTSMTFSQSFLWHLRIPLMSTALEDNMHQNLESTDQW